jgi:hypothetical protein
LITLRSRSPCWALGVIDGGRSGAVPGDDVQEVAYRLLTGDWVGERQVGLDRVVVAAAPALARDVAGRGKLADDAVRGALCDADRLADLAQTNAGIGRDAQQDAGVIGKKRPGWRAVALHFIPDY